jgi:MFS family permease
MVILFTQSIINGNWAGPVDAAGAALLGSDGKAITAFQDWGWRVPFLLSIFLLGVSLYIRLQMEESPAFRKIKEEGKQSKAPLREAFGTWKNGKYALVALLGLVAGQAVVWYSGQFYALFFIQNVVKVDSFTANVLVAWSLIIGTGFFLVFGNLSDRIGRKPIILGGCLIAALTYFWVFPFITQTANPKLHAAHQSTVVTVTTDPALCSFQFNPTGTAKFTSSCDVAKALLARSSVTYSTVAAAPGTQAIVKIGETEIPSFDSQQNAADIAATKKAVEEVSAAIDPALLTALGDAEKGLAAAKAAVAAADKALKAAADDAARATAQTALDTANAGLAAAQAAADAARAAVPADQLADLDAARAAAAEASGVKAGFEKAVTAALKAAGYPVAGVENPDLVKIDYFFDIFSAQKLTLIATLVFLIVLVTMVYGPIAAALVELFPTRIRYSGLSLPYHIGNGWFGGLLPATAFAISAQTGNIYAGLWYAVVVAAGTFVIGLIFVPETYKRDIFAEEKR